MRLSLPLLALTACAGLCGCVATQRDVLDIEQQADETKAQIVELKKVVSSLQANQADLSVKVDQIHSDLGAFTETLKDSQNSMSQLSSKMDDLDAALGQKVAGLGASITKQQNQLEAKIEQTAATAEQAHKEAERLAAAQARTEKDAAGPTPSRLFHSAQAQMNRGRYALAAQGFEAYLRKYPKGEVANLATFYLGEAYYNQKSWQSAAKQYALVIDRFPKSDLIPASRLKYALCLVNMKKNLPEAKRYLQSIPEDFPKSPEAPLARKALKRLGT